jgi:hypothetical protein
VLGAKAPHLERQGAAVGIHATLAGVDQAAQLVQGSSGASTAVADEGRSWARVEVLGRWRVSHFGRTVELAPQVARLVKLVASMNGSVHIEEVLEALWPEATPERGRRRLRNVSARLTRSAGPVVVRRGELLVLAEGVSLDAALFQSRARRALSILLLAALITRLRPQLELRKPSI